MCEGYYHNRELSWDETRWLGALIFNANSKKSKTPQELVPLKLDAERVNTSPKINVNRLREIMKAKQEELNQKNGKQ